MTVLKLLPETVPWLQTFVTPAGGEVGKLLLTVTMNIMVTFLPGGMVPRFWLIVSPDWGVSCDFAVIPLPALRDELEAWGPCPESLVPDCSCAGGVICTSE